MLVDKNVSARLYVIPAPSTKEGRVGITEPHQLCIMTRSSAFSCFQCRPDGRTRVKSPIKLPRASMVTPTRQSIFFKGFEHLANEGSALGSLHQLTADRHLLMCRRHSEL